MKHARIYKGDKMYDLIIKNGTIVDGTGNPWYKADVGIKDGKIAAIARTGLDDGQRVINAAGWVVSPGFCDLHAHSDFTILYHNRAENALHQGVTTEGTGQCGQSMYPLTEAQQENAREVIASFALEDVEEVTVDWTTLEEWRNRVEDQGLGINLAPYCGHGTVRQCVMGVEGKGGERYEPTPEEMDKMKAMVRQAMEDGAFGLSTGLRYPPGRNAFTEEVIELSKVAAESGGVYISHMRSESDTLIESVKELIRICEEAGLPGSMSHHKAMLRENWGKPSETMRLLDEARARGLEIMCDFYPWTHAAESNLGSAFLPHLLSPELSPQEKKHKVENLRQEIQDPQTWEEGKRRAREEFAQQVENNQKRREALKKRGVQVPNLWDPETFYYVVHSRTHPELVGKNLREIAQVMGMEDYWDAARDLYLADEGTTYIAAGIMREEDVITILKHPASSVSTDGHASDQPPAFDDPRAGTHPRNYGTYPKVLQRYVRDMKILRLEEAIRKMTSLPLQFLGIKDRGLIKEGMWADVVVFDPQQIENKATYAEPCLHPVGIHYVLVNGQIAIEEGRHTGMLAGRVLRRA
jgi:N-acyl-D-amino-acid deacylase